MEALNIEAEYRKAFPEKTHPYATQETFLKWAKLMTQFDGWVEDDGDFYSREEWDSQYAEPEASTMEALDPLTEYRKEFPEEDFPFVMSSTLGAWIAAQLREGKWVEDDNGYYLREEYTEEETEDAEVVKLAELLYGQSEAALIRSWEDVPRVQRPYWHKRAYHLMERGFRYQPDRDKTL